MQTRRVNGLELEVEASLDRSQKENKAEKVQRMASPVSVEDGSVEAVLVSGTSGFALANIGGTDYFGSVPLSGNLASSKGSWYKISKTDCGDIRGFGQEFALSPSTRYTAVVFDDNKYTVIKSTTGRWCSLAKRGKPFLGAAASLTWPEAPSHPFHPFRRW